MNQKKYDGVVEAVHYKPNGEVAWVRVYERRGATFSDHYLLERQAFIQRLKSGKSYRAGKRLEGMGGTFEVSALVLLEISGGKEILTTENNPAERDHLAGVPAI